MERTEENKTKHQNIFKRKYLETLTVSKQKRTKVRVTVEKLSVGKLTFVSFKELRISCLGL